MECVSYLSTKLSYRDATETANRLFHRLPEQEIKLRTLSDGIQRVGTEIVDTLMEETHRILSDNGFNPETGLPLETTILSSNVTGAVDPGNPSSAYANIQKAIDRINAVREEKIPFTAEEFQPQIEADPEHCVYISIDDIGVKRQKDSRGDGSVRDTKFVENTNVHIQYGDFSYVITAVGMDKVFLAILAFLLQNDLLKYELIFLTDGARDIKNRIESFFAFHPHTTILDWFHLKKKCMELLSMGMRGKDKRNTTLEKLLRYLWVGDIPSAKQYLVSLPPSSIKNQKWINEIVSYLDRKQDTITCYAIRAELNLRNSSNPVEKANDLLVAQRQKHNGMAWTPNGSGTLASIQMIYQNNQADLWFREKKILFFTESTVGDGKLCA
ncbi:MAG: hypothetical protein LUC27_08365 [Lachnospiraceae bacterium]|nr:hypothetical protein [Lachnospiraceae bacterium]